MTQLSIPTRSLCGLILLLGAAPVAAQQPASSAGSASGAAYFANPLEQGRKFSASYWVPTDGASGRDAANACLLRSSPKREANAFPRAVPQLDATGEGNSIEARGDAEWGRLSYPTGRMPQGDWRGRAIAQIKTNIPETAPPQAGRACAGRGHSAGSHLDENGADAARQQRGRRRL